MNLLCACACPDASVVVYLSLGLSSHESHQVFALFLSFNFLLFLIHRFRLWCLLTIRCVLHHLLSDFCRCNCAFLYHFVCEGLCVCRISIYSRACRKCVHPLCFDSHRSRSLANGDIASTYTFSCPCIPQSESRNLRSLQKLVRPPHAFITHKHSTRTLMRCIRVSGPTELSHYHNYSRLLRPTTQCYDAIRLPILTARVSRGHCSSSLYTRRKHRCILKWQRTPESKPTSR